MGLKSLDFFRKLPSEVETSTACGGIYSILALIVYNSIKSNQKFFFFLIIKIGIFLFFSEFSLFISKEISREMIIDNNVKSNQLAINIDIEFFHLPCLGKSNF